MRKIVHIAVLCLMTISLSGMPVASAFANAQFQETSHCVKMTTAAHQIDTELAGLDDLDCCCGQCTANCACPVSASCHSLSGQNMTSALLSDLTTSSAAASLLKINLFNVSCHGTTASPEIRPPIV